MVKITIDSKRVYLSDEVWNKLKEMKIELKLKTLNQVIDYLIKNNKTMEDLI
jgi:predicted CopG family antitoxin